MVQKPNILLVCLDQLRADILSSYGGVICKTPALDRLASDSVVFDRAYTPTAVCTPARASLLTGQYPHNHGAASNESSLFDGTLRDADTLLSRRLEALGYARWYTGKWHLGGADNLPADLGLPGQQFPGHGGGGFHYPEFLEYLSQRGLEFSLSDGWHQVGWHRYGTLAGTGDEEPSAFITESALSFLDAQASGDGNPFFLWVNYWGPHEPYVAPRRCLELYETLEIPPWPNFVDDGPLRPRVHRLKMPSEIGMGDWDFWKPAVRHYFAYMSLIDEQIGRLLDRLEGTGQAENTVVIVTADHGESLGAHGCQDKGHFMYEETYRVPFLVRWPGRMRPRREQTHVSLVDVCPTILDLVGDTDPTQGRDGLSLMELLIAGQSIARDEVVAEFHGLVTPFTQRMVVRDNLKYVWNMGDRDELYDLDADPYELTNLIQTSGWQSEVHRLQEALFGWMKKTSDPAQAYFERHRLCQKEDVH